MSTTESAACRVCAGESHIAFRLPVLGRPVGFYDCPDCGYFQTETPTWLGQAYSKAINDSDTGIMIRNQQNVGKVVVTLHALRRLRGTVVDYAGGYGILVRMLRDVGVDALWSDKYCDNLLATGFEAKNTRCDLLTAFEVFEHFVHPVEELRKMLADAPAVLLSTELILTQVSPSPSWWYLGTDHGQHIGFFRLSTLRKMALTLGCDVQSDGRSTHLFSRQPVSRSWRPLIAHHSWWRLLALRRLHSKTDDDAKQHVSSARS